MSSHTADTTGEHSVFGVFEAFVSYGLGNARHLFVNDFKGGFGGDVTRCKTSAPRGEHQDCAVINHTDDGLFDSVFVIGDDFVFYIKTAVRQKIANDRTAFVLSFTVKRAV